MRTDRNERNEIRRDFQHKAILLFDDLEQSGAQRNRYSHDDTLTDTLTVIRSQYKERR
jgi:hypothetical protein